MTRRSTFAAAILLGAWASQVAAADAVVVTDQSSGVVITRSTVAEMVKADAQAASLFGLPAPGADAEAQVTAALKADFADTQPAIKTMLGHAHRDLPLAMPYLASNTPKSRAAFVAKMKPEIMKATSTGSRLLNLTEVLVGLGEKGAKTGVGAAGGDRARLFSYMQSQDRIQHSMQQGIRSSFTSCNTYNGAMQQNWSYCHP